MSEARVWTIDIAFTASEDHTRADALLDAGADRYHGWAAPAGTLAIRTDPTSVKRSRPLARSKTSWCSCGVPLNTTSRTSKATPSTFTSDAPRATRRELIHGQQEQVRRCHRGRRARPQRAEDPTPCPARARRRGDCRRDHAVGRRRRAVGPRGVLGVDHVVGGVAAEREIARPTQLLARHRLHSGHCANDR